MWRYILAGFTGAVAGVAILVGAVLLVPEEEAVSSGSQNAMLCADALTRRQNADMVIANPPMDGPYSANAKALKEAGVQRTTAHADVGRFCGGS